MALVTSLLYAVHLSQDLHLKLIEAVQVYLSNDAKVTHLGNGVFDGTYLQKLFTFMDESGWYEQLKPAFILTKSKKWRFSEEWKLQLGQMVVRQCIGFSGEG